MTVGCLFVLFGCTERLWHNEFELPCAPPHKLSTHGTQDRAASGDEAMVKR